MEIDTIFRRVKRLRSVGSMRHTVDHQINPSVVGSHLHSNLQWPFRCCNHLCSRVEEFTQRPTADSIDTNLFFECFICAPVELYCLMCTVYLSNKNTQAITFVHDNIDFARSENDRRKFYQSFPNFNELDSLDSCGESTHVLWTCAKASQELESTKPWYKNFSNVREKRSQNKRHGRKTQEQRKKTVKSFPAPVLRALHARALMRARKRSVSFSRFSRFLFCFGSFCWFWSFFVCSLRFSGGFFGGEWPNVPSFLLVFGRLCVDLGIWRRKRRSIFLNGEYVWDVHNIYIMFM